MNPILIDPIRVQGDFLGSELPSNVTIVEVGPRDGLQNEKQAVSLSRRALTRPHTYSWNGAAYLTSLRLT